MRIGTALLIIIGCFFNIPKIQARSPIKQIDASIRFLVDLVKKPPLLPTQDAEISFKIAQTFQKLTGTQTPTREQIQNSLLKFPPSYFRNSLLASFSSDVDYPPNEVQTKEILNHLIILADLTPPYKKYHNHYEWKLPVSVDLPSRPAKFSKEELELNSALRIEQNYYNERFALLWNTSPLEVRRNFLMKHDFIGQSPSENHWEKHIFESDNIIKNSSPINIYTLSEAFERNKIYHTYLINTYILKDEPQSLLSNLKSYRDMAAREWAHMNEDPNIAQFQFLEKSYDLSPNGKSSLLERRQDYIDLAVEKLENMEPRARDSIFKDYSFWVDNVELHPPRFKREVARMAQQMDVPTIASKFNLEPKEIWRWVAKENSGTPHSDIFKEAIVNASYLINPSVIARSFKLDYELVNQWLKEDALRYPEEVQKVGIWLTNNIGVEHAYKELNLNIYILKFWLKENVQVGNDDEEMFSVLNKLGIKSIMLLRKEAELYPPEQRQEFIAKWINKIGMSKSSRIFNMSMREIERIKKIGTSE